MNEIIYPRRIKEWPEDDRPRERFIKYGPESLSDAELLAIILRTGDASTKKTALDHAKTLIASYGSFRVLEGIPIPELCSIKGLGKAKAVQIKAALEIAKRFSTQRIKEGESFKGSREVFKHFHERMRNKKKEIFGNSLAS